MSSDRFHRHLTVLAEAMQTNTQVYCVDNKQTMQNRLSVVSVTLLLLQ